ncbi:expressed unknown protein [Seminavis robusta]|uniref:Uncharacterized protein n=1 Tax=Seminavis robusta TaxID=568900 RepID=A0A9N8HTZ3_9STRA|nr:expressed unknown protein [Seminavis robusta]|eukprot:Sro1670_g289970.1 n/a (219) ;mRNA; f:11597-12253
MAAAAETFGEETKRHMIHCLPNTAESAICIPKMPYSLRSDVTAKLQQLEHLVCLEIFIPEEGCREWVDTIGEKVFSGQLQTLFLHLNGAQPNDSLFPLFDDIAAAGSSALALTKFAVLGQKKHASLYQDRMIEILQSNTTLEDVYVGLWGVARDEKQQLISYYANLNKYGRGLARDPRKPLRDTVKMLRKLGKVNGELDAAIGFRALWDFAGSTRSMD